MVILRIFRKEGPIMEKYLETAREAHKEAIELIADEDISLVEIYELMAEYSKTSRKESYV